MKIISIGDLVTDFYYKDNKLVGINGGMTSHNIVANIATMNIPTAVYGVCGDDMAGKIAIKSLEDIGVNIDNIEIIKDLKTRCFHVSYFEKNEKLEFTSKKRCPICNQKNWYEESNIDVEDILKKINIDDILVFDNLNLKNQTIIDKSHNKKMLDLGQYFELDNYKDEEIIEKIKNKFEIINLNERVEKYLKKRYSIKKLEEIYNMFNPKLIIVTRGKKGSDFAFDNTKITKELTNPAEELDSTGAGDAFFSCFISEYIKKDYIIDKNFIDETFGKATKLTKKVVKKLGARGHIQGLYKIKKIKNTCSCQNFELSIRKKIKRCNININNLEIRVINALKSDAYNKIKAIDFLNLKNSIFIGTGGSFAPAKIASKIINDVYGITTLSLLPRDVYYRNNSQVDKAFLFTYSGTTNDLYVSTFAIKNDNKYIITKGEIQKIIEQTKIDKNNIISYRTKTNKSKERGFLSFEGSLVPASLFLKLYFEEKEMNNVEEFIKECINYWKQYFNNNIIKFNEMLENGNQFNIFMGDFTESSAIDLESKIIESGIYNCLVHEKKNFSHGRFINYEHLNNKNSIYLKQKSTSLYEEKLLNYLSNNKTLIIESRYDGILCEYDLLVAVQYLIHYIANYLNIDISKPTYTEEAMKIYFYKGNL